jgi:hypothetical protein
MYVRRTPELYYNVNSQSQEEEDEIEKTIFECTQRAREETAEKENDNTMTLASRMERCYKILNSSCMSMVLMEMEELRYIVELGS